MDLDILGTTVQIDTGYLAADDATVRQQVQDYCAGTRKDIDIAVRRPDGFLGTVMEAMAAIPYGETRTYGELAARVDTAAVAVGQACWNNPVPVIVPCHRVVAEDSVGGYQYRGLKEKLLDLEAKNCNGP